MWRSCAFSDSSRSAKSRCSARSSASGMSVGSSYASAAIAVAAPSSRRRIARSRTTCAWRSISTAVGTVSVPARTVELFAARELDLDRQRVDALAALQERTRRVVDQPVARDVEVVRAKEVGDLEDRVPVDEQAPQDLLLGAIVERHLPLGAA